MKRPKDMTADELDALPVVEQMDPRIMRAQWYENDDFIDYRDANGARWRLRTLPSGEWVRFKLY